MYSHHTIAAFVLSALAFSVPCSAQTTANRCEPAPPIRQALQRISAESAGLPVRSKQERELAALKSLLKAHPEDVFVHHAYQDAFLAVRENDISDFPICNKSFDLSYCGNDL